VSTPFDRSGRIASRVVSWLSSVPNAVRSKIPVLRKRVFMANP
jgi:phage terminase Nu1 subunit (DNA packaging protein)